MEESVKAFGAIVFSFFSGVLFAFPVFTSSLFNGTFFFFLFFLVHKHNVFLNGLEYSLMMLYCLYKNYDT